MNNCGPNPRWKIWLADAGLLYAAAIWGATFFMVKDALSGVHPITMVTYRFLLAGFLLLIFLLLTRRSLLANLKRGFYLSLLLWLLYVPQTIGLGLTTASNSGFITGLFVAFVPLFLLTIFKRRPTLMEILASVVALFGLWILTGGLTYINTGDLLTLLAAMAYALHLLYSDRYMKDGLDPFVISCQQFLLVGFYSLIAMIVFDLPFQVTTTAALGTIIFLALFPTMSAFVIQMMAQKITSPLKVSLIFALEPVFAGLFAWTLGDEPFIWRRAGGGLLIFLALIISGMPPRKQFYSIGKRFKT